MHRIDKCSNCGGKIFRPYGHNLWFHMAEKRSHRSIDCPIQQAIDYHPTATPATASTSPAPVEPAQSWYQSPC